MHASVTAPATTAPATSVRRAGPIPAADPTVLGVERRLVAPAVIIVAIVAVFALLIPAIDAVVQHDDPIAAGTTLEAGMDVRFTPAVGWELTPGRDLVIVQRAAGAVQVRDAGVTFTVLTGRYQGSLGQLTARADDATASLDGTHVTGPAGNVTTAGGVAGTVTEHTGVTTQATTYAFLNGLTGVQVLVAGPSAAFATRRAAVEAMVRSLVIPETKPRAGAATNGAGG